MMAAREIWKDLTCKHPSITTGFTSNTFLVDRWERCSGAAMCDHCGRSFFVHVPAQEDMLNENEECGRSCHVHEVYGFVPEADCPVHDAA